MRLGELAVPEQLAATAVAMWQVLWVDQVSVWEEPAPTLRQAAVEVATQVVQPPVAWQQQAVRPLVELRTNLAAELAAAQGLVDQQPAV